MPAYLVTTGARDKIDRVHTITCKRAIAAGAKRRNLTDPGGRTPASCCKPKFEAPADKVKAATKAAAQVRGAISERRKAKASTSSTTTTSTREGRRTNTTTSAGTKAPAKRGAPRKAAASKAPKVKAPAIPDVAGARAAAAAGADPHPGRREELSRDETKAARQARSAGAPVPPTPNADYVAQEYANGIDAAARKGLVKQYEAALRGEAASTGRGRSAPTVRFYRNGKPQPDSQNRISSLAYGFTRNLDGDRPRIPGPALREIIVNTTGVADPEHEPWALVLANGEALEAKVEQS